MLFVSYITVDHSVYYFSFLFHQHPHQKFIVKAHPLDMSFYFTHNNRARGVLIMWPGLQQCLVFFLFFLFFLLYSYIITCRSFYFIFFLG